MTFLNPVPLVWIMLVNAGCLSGLGLLFWAKVSASCKTMRVCPSCSLPAAKLGARCTYCGQRETSAIVAKGVLSLFIISALAYGGVWAGSTFSQNKRAGQGPSSSAITAMLIDVNHTLDTLRPTFNVQWKLPSTFLPPSLGHLPMPKFSRPTAKAEASPTALMVLNHESVAPGEKTINIPPSNAPVVASDNFLNPMVSRSPDNNTGALNSEASHQASEQVLTCGGLVPLETPEPDFSLYMTEMQGKIRRNWTPPNLDRNNRVVVSYRIGCDGHLLQARILESSRQAIADQAALAAIHAAAPYNPLPSAYRGQAIEVQFSFDYDMATRFVHGKGKAGT